jgi:FKBP-type peptidyl-prolyl cis-trans isomerase FklB
MKRTFRLFLVWLVLILAGCSREEPAPTVPQRDEVALQREHFFGDGAKEPGIAWRSSGLGIKIITPGEGTAPAPTDLIRVQYVGRLKDGRVFDDSHVRGKPSDFTVNRLIIGWAAAMPSLKPGGKAVFFIPPSLGYGGLHSGDIPSVSGLIFEVELIAVNPEPAAKPQRPSCSPRKRNILSFFSRHGGL